MTDWTKNRVIWGLLTDEEQAELKATGGPFEFLANYKDRWKPCDPAWMEQFVYRLAPAKPFIDWSQVAERFICLSEDAYSACVFERPPTEAEKGWLYSGGSVAYADVYPSYRPGTCDWRDSLIYRPGFEPEGSK